MDCIICKIIKGEIPCYKIFENDDVLAFLDINPVNPGHTLIIPKEHTLDFNTIDKNKLISILDVAKDLSETITSKMNADGYSLIQNNGIAQEVKHFHLHIIPKYKSKKKMTVEESYNILTK